MVIVNVWVAWKNVAAIAYIKLVMEHAKNGMMQLAAAVTNVMTNKIVVITNVTHNVMMVGLEIPTASA